MLSVLERMASRSDTSKRQTDISFLNNQKRNDEAAIGLTAESRLTVPDLLTRLLRASQ